MNDLRFVGMLLLLAVIATGCKRSVSVVATQLEWVVESMPPTADANDVQARTQRALAMWDNGVMDREPVIFYAVLAHPTDLPNALVISMYDEDNDIVGIGVREERVCEDGRILLRDEQYPIYVHNRGEGELLDEAVVPVRIRDGGQEMDIRQWEAYARAEGDHLFTNWSEMLPPVWVSPPGSKEVDVYVYVYDQAGHKSRPARLVHWPGVKREK